MAKIINITVDELKQIYDKGSIVICDVREADEFEREHIIGAINQPLSNFENNNLNALSNGQKLVIHCQSGNRTKMSANKFSSLNLDEVYILDGGINAWKSQGCVTEKNNKAPLPLMRQVQIVAGFLIVLGVILGYTFNHNWFLLSGFVGMGLMFAGITGFCGMANILMLLPYNKQNKCNNSCVTKNN